MWGIVAKMSKHDKPFYGEEILRDEQEAYIESLLKKYCKEKADASLKQKIWDELQAEKTAGRITIPFKVILDQDPAGNFAPQIKVILDSKV